MIATCTTDAALWQIQAMQDDLLTRYLVPDSDDETARQFVAGYAQELLTSASPAELLFHGNEFGAAAFSYRVPEELVSLTPQKVDYPAMLHEQV